MPTRYGLNDYHLPAGPCRLSVEMHLINRFGLAETTFQIIPGAAAEIWYAPPHHRFAEGRLGFSRQTAAGLLSMLAIMLALFGSVFLLICSIGFIATR